MFNKSGNAFQKDTPVIKNLIIFTGIVWLAQVIIKQANITEMGALHYYQSEAFRPYQLVTAMFLHSPQGPMHIFFNMFTLYFFGTILERVWGSKKFLFFYLFCGIGAAFTEQLAIPFLAEKFANGYVPADGIRILHSEIVEAYKQQYSSLGASGAIMGVLAAFAFLFPNTPLMFIFIPVPIKAKYLVGIYVLLDLFGGFSGFQGDNTAHFAHLGGALFGFILVLYWNKTNKKTFY
jgi:membrane associated rhomboid family serine protease